MTVSVLVGTFCLTQVNGFRRNELLVSHNYSYCFCLFLQNGVNAIMLAVLRKHTDIALMLLETPHVNVNMQHNVCACVYVCACV